MKVIVVPLGAGAVAAVVDGVDVPLPSFGRLVDVAGDEEPDELHPLIPIPAANNSSTTGPARAEGIHRDRPANLVFVFMRATYIGLSPKMRFATPFRMGESR